jgi:nucleoid-associated protein EbfC
MFDQFKTMGALAGLMKNPDRLKQAGDDLKHQLETIRVTGEAGAGAVRVTASGDMTIVNIELSPSTAAALSDESSARMLESLIMEASNAALSQARVQAQATIARLAEELGIPSIPGLDRLLSS